MIERSVREIMQEWVDAINNQPTVEFEPETIDLTNDNVTITNIDDMVLDNPDPVLKVTHNADGTVDVHTENYEFYGCYPVLLDVVPDSEPLSADLKIKFTK